MAHQISIPPNLQDDRFRFCILGVQNKHPIEKNWPSRGYRYNAPELLRALEAGHNYGVICGTGGLVVIDFDDLDFCKSAGLRLIPTFATMSPTRKGPHFYYLVNDDNPKGFFVDSPDGRRLADIQGIGKCVVGPGCVHPKYPDGPPYQVVWDRPFETVPLQWLRWVFKDYIREQPVAIRRTGKRYDGREQIDFSRIRISDLLSRYGGIDRIKWSGGLRRGKCRCPLGHDSQGGACFSFDDAKGVWHCFHCEESGNAVQLAMKLTGLEFKQILEMVKEGQL